MTLGVSADRALQMGAIGLVYGSADAEQRGLQHDRTTRDHGDQPRG